MIDDLLNDLLLVRHRKVTVSTSNDFIQHLANRVSILGSSASVDTLHEVYSVANMYLLGRQRRTWSPSVSLCAFSQLTAPLYLDTAFHRLTDLLDPVPGALDVNFHIEGLLDRDSACFPSPTALQRCSGPPQHHFWPTTPPPRPVAQATNGAFVTGRKPIK